MSSSTSRIQIEHLYISPGHNYFGHHGQPAGQSPLLEVDAVECVAGHGLVGDRFFDFKANYKGQITFFSAEVFEEVCTAIGVSGKHPGLTRRNVITRGVELNALVGQEFEVQGVRFQGVAECAPCYWMDQAIGAGAEAAIKSRGGLRARILSSGHLSVER
jgi:MOSC domain-containing protein YiiM